MDDFNFSMLSQCSFRCFLNAIWKPARTRKLIEKREFAKEKTSLWSAVPLYSVLVLRSIKENLFNFRSFLFYFFVLDFADTSSLSDSSRTFQRETWRPPKSLVVAQRCRELLGGLERRTKQARLPISNLSVESYFAIQYFQYFPLLADTVAEFKGQLIATDLTDSDAIKKHLCSNHLVKSQ